MIVESILRGTAGGICGALQRLGEGPVIVINVDVFSTTNYLGLLEIIENNPVVLSVAHRPQGQGTVGIDSDGCVVRMRGVSFGTEVSGGDYVGIAAIGPDIVGRLPPQGCLVGDVMMPLLKSGIRIRTLLEESSWTDIGSLAGYGAANFEWLERNGLDFWTGPGAGISSRTELRNVIVGRGAQVDLTGVLRRVIIWPGAHLDTPLTDAVVMSSGQIVPIPSS